MKRIAFATHGAEPEITSDDLLAREPLRALGIEIVAWPWDGARPAAPLDGVVLRSCWSYDERPEAFLAWVVELARSGVRLLNPEPVVRGNLSKRYLAELAAQGVSVPTTVHLERGARVTLEQVLREHGLDAAVVKPEISLSAHHTWCTSRATAAEHEERFRALLDERPLLVQAFLEEISTRGEVSLVWIGGHYSHAVRKLPRAGDFRVQLDHGGTREPALATRAQIAEAERILAATPGPVSYARIDLVESAGRPMLMELELIDPVLFLGWHPEAPARFAQAIAAQL